METQQQDTFETHSQPQLRNVLVACKLDASDRQLLHYGCALTRANGATLHPALGKHFFRTANALNATI